jgi:hypothetical protein
MASIVLGAAGSAFAGPVGGMLGGALGSFIDNKLFNHRWIQKPNPWDLIVESAAFGTAIPVAFNRCLLAGNLIQSTNLIPAEHNSKGGKGGGSSKGQPYYTYSATFATVICRTTDNFGNNRPVKNIWRIYADSKVLWSRDPNDQTIDTDNNDTNLQSAYQPVYDFEGNEIGGYATVYEMNTSKNANAQNAVGTVRLWYGYETQTPDYFLVQTFGAAAVPAYRGYAIAVFVGFPLQWFGNRLPQLKYELNGWPSAAVANLSTPPPTLPPGGAPQTTFTGASLVDSNVKAYPTSLSTGLTYLCDENQVTPLFSQLCSICEPVVPLNAAAGTIDPVIAGTPGYADGVLFQTPNQGPSGFGADSTLWLSVQPASGSAGGPALLQLIGGAGAKQIFPLASPGSSGLTAMVGSGLTAYCDGLLFVSDNSTRFQVYDLSRLTAAGNPSLALMGDFALNEIYQFTDVASPLLVWKGVSGAGGFVSPTSVAWAASRNELVIYDGNHGVQFVLTGGGNSSLYTSLTAMSEPITRGGGEGISSPGPIYVAYDAVNDIFLYQGAQAIYGFSDVTTDGLLPASTVPMAAAAGWGNTLPNQPLEGSVAAASAGVFYLIQTAPPFSVVASWSWAAAIDTPAPNAQVLYSPAYGGSMNWPTFDSNGFGFFSRSVDADDLADIVGAIMQQCGLTPDRYDVSALTGTPVYGYFVGVEASGRAAIEPLQEVYLFDLIDSGSKLVARFRQAQAAAPAFILTQTDLAPRTLHEGQQPGERPQPRFIERRKQDLEIPQQVTLRYRTTSGSRYVQDFCMEIGTQYMKRNHALVGALGKISVNTPIVMTDAMAQQLCETVLFNQWVQRTDFELTMPIRYLACEAGDVITLGFNDFDGNWVNYLIYVTDAVLGADNTIAVKGMLTYPSVMLGSPSALGGLTGGSIALPNGGQPPTPFSTNLVLLDIPPLQDSDDNPGLYWGVGASSATSLWMATLQRSLDGGQSYATIGTTGIQAAIGAATTALGAWASKNWDTVNELTVRFYTPGTGLFSVTPEQVLNGQNVFLVGSELLGAANCVLNEDGTYTLSLLIRGLQGTDINGGSHTGGEQVVRLGIDGSINDFIETLGDIGISETYAAIPAGGSLATAVLRQETLVGARIKPEAAASAFVTRDISNNATISWIPRRRINWQWNDGPEVPYTDEQGGETYSIDIYNGSAVVRTITAFSAMTGTVGPAGSYDLGIRQASYSATDQTSDGLTPGDPIKCSVYELSTRTGWGGTRGFGRNITQ